MQFSFVLFIIYKLSDFMQNKGVVIALTIIITALCVYYLSFTFVSRRVNKDATAYATDEKGSLSLTKKQQYLDSMWSLPVYNLLGAEYTYKEVKDNELSLGLDLQGGMHVVLEISPGDIIRGLSGNSQDPALTAAIQAARQKQKTSTDNFADLFYDAYKQANPGKDLASMFASAANRNKITSADSDDKVVKFLKDEIESAIDRSYTILNTRINQFGTSEAKVQRLQQSGRLQIEIPGADNPGRVRKLLQGVAKLEFWEVIEYSDPQLSSALMGVNQMLLKEQTAKSITEKTTTADQKTTVTT